MARIGIFGALALVCSLVGAVADAQEVRVFEQNGIIYRESRQVTPIGVVPPKLEPRQRTIYRERYTTELKEVTRTVQTPVTQYQMTPVLERSLNPFAAPYVAYRMLPQTHWVAQNQTVRIPVTRKEIVPNTITEMVPVPRTNPGEPGRLADTVPTVSQTVPTLKQTVPTVREIAPTLAQRPNLGGVSKLESDPPRSGASNWRPAETTVIR